MENNIFIYSWEKILIPLAGLVVIMILNQARSCSFKINFFFVGYKGVLFSMSIFFFKTEIQSYLKNEMLIYCRIQMYFFSDS